MLFSSILKQYYLNTHITLIIYYQAVQQCTEAVLPENNNNKKGWGVRALGTSAGGSLQLNTHAPYICGFAWSDVAWMCGVHRMHQTGSSFTWHHPCNNQTALQVHHFGGCSKRAMKVYVTDFISLALQKTSWYLCTQQQDVLKVDVFDKNEFSSQSQWYFLFWSAWVCMWVCSTELGSEGWESRVHPWDWESERHPHVQYCT